MSHYSVADGRTRGATQDQAAAQPAAEERPRPDHAAAARRLPRADEPVVVDAGAARHDRADPARDPRGLDDRDPPGPRVARPRARPVPADRGRDRRPPALAGLLVDRRPRPSRRPDLDHRQARPRGPDVAALHPPDRTGGDRLPRRGGGHLRPAGSTAPEAALRQRRQRDHPDHEHAARARAAGRPRRRRPRPQRALRRERHLRRPARRDGRAPPWLRAPHPLHREQGPPRPSGDRRALRRLA